MKIAAKSEGSRSLLSSHLVSALVHSYNAVIQDDSVHCLPLAPPLHTGQCSLETSAIQTGDALIFVPCLHVCRVTALCCCSLKGWGG